MRHPSMSGSPLAVLLLCWLGLGPALATAQPGGAATSVVTPALGSPVLLPQARAIELRAQASGHRYRILVSVPGTPAPPSGHPVMYVLDGNAGFPVAAFVARTVERRQESTGQTPPMVVGIGYPGDQDFDYGARRRDYTPHPTRPPAGAPEGGAEAFLDFIEQDLKPMLRHHFPVDDHRQALFGHSFGGLLVLHALFTRPAQFSAFLASSPSIWWQDNALLKRVPASVPDCDACRPRVQISVGELEDRIPPGQHSAQTLALLASRPMVLSARQLAADLRSRPEWRERVRYLELAGEDHGFAWMPALVRGMDFFLQAAPVTGRSQP